MGPGRGAGSPCTPRPVRPAAEGEEADTDVVYNHTGEGNHLGPTLSMRGIDNVSYYRTVADNHRYYTEVIRVLPVRGR
jgi:hypothetical protein